MPTDISYLVQRIDVQRLRWDVAALAAGERHGLRSPGRHATAREYIQGAFLVAALEGRQHTFTYAGRSGMNIISRKVGRTPDLPPLLVSAHYDTVPGSPGADDNASGVTAMLECARVLASAPIQRTVDFVAFDMEERQPEGEGVIGSAAFVRDLARAAGYQGVYNLEMVGYTSGPGTQGFPPGFQFFLPRAYHHVEGRRFSGDSVAVVAQAKGAMLSQCLVAAAADYAPDLDVLPVVIPAGLPIPPDVFRGDHAPFWAAGIPAVLVTDTANFRNPHYHTAQDTADTLDYLFLYRVTCALVAAVAQQAA